MSKRVSAVRPPAAKKNRATRTSKKPRELKLYRLKNPDFYEKAVAAHSEDEARKIVGGTSIGSMTPSCYGKWHVGRASCFENSPG